MPSDGRDARRIVHGLNALRAFFIGWVVLYHLNLPLQVMNWPAHDPLIGRGYLGVDGFFLLSGFVLYLQYHALPAWRPAAWAGFVARRAVRIYPGHLAVLAILVLLLGVATAGGIAIRDWDRFRMSDLVKQVLLINAWWTTDRHAWNYVAWALSAEWFGYLLFPVFLSLARAVPAAAALPAGALAILSLAWLEATQGQVRLNVTFAYGLCRFSAEFLAGLLLARAAAFLPHPRTAWHGAAVVVAASLACVLVAFQPWDWLVVAALAGTILTVHQLERGSLRPETYLVPVLGWLGSRSFALFITFVLVEVPLTRLLAAGLLPAGWQAVAITLAAHMLLAEVLFRAVEAPSHRALGRMLPPLPGR